MAKEELKIEEQLSEAGKAYLAAAKAKENPTKGIIFTRFKDQDYQIDIRNITEDQIAILQAKKSPLVKT